MTQNPILRVLFTLKKFGVKYLLIGGQACIIYGAAEFSRDSDFIISCDRENLTKLKKALRALKARNIYVPPLKKRFLDKGHGCHFRCYAEFVRNLRIDIIAKLRGCDKFEKLWQRRFTVKLSHNKDIEVIGLEDLVQSKKTQRDKDWLMLNRLVENDIISTHNPPEGRIKWWLYECRNVEILSKLIKAHRNLAKECSVKRPLLRAGFKKDFKKLKRLLVDEELSEREKDRRYWRPLMKELEILRQAKNRSADG